MAYKVCLDPGHGDFDPGAVGPKGIKEKNVNLAVCLKVGNFLKNAGITVVYTRTSDTVSWAHNINADLAARCEIAKQSGADIFVSIHCNSGPPSAHGTETYCIKFGGNGEKLCRNIHENLIRQLGLTDRGVKTANYYVLRKTDMPGKTNIPAALVELAFISNPNEEQLLANPDFQEKAARAIAMGIASYFGVSLNLGGNQMSQIPGWKVTAVQEALRKGIILEYHDPLEKVDVGTLCAMMLNLLKVVGK